jgi:hypothetical protein
MYQMLQVLCLFLAAIGLALTLAHALEFPGKRRLDRATYAAVQTVYYPGFTIGGLFGEVGAIVATALLAIVTPRASPAFWPTLVALSGLITMHGLYWVLTHPVNRFWLKDQKLGRAGSGFFGVGYGSGMEQADWTEFRDRWELSHVARALCAAGSFIALAIAATL